MASPYLFESRVEAARQLAVSLERYHGRHPVVIGIPRGGMPVAAEMARLLHGELDFCVARKIPSPFSPDRAVGAVTADGVRFLSAEAIWSLGVPQAYLDAAAEREANEAWSRDWKYRKHRPEPALDGRLAILVDDGLATGATMCAAARSVRRRRPARLAIAAPVGSDEARELLADEADEIICLHRPRPFTTVAGCFREYDPVQEGEVCALLDHAGEAAPAPAR